MSNRKKIQKPSAPKFPLNDIFTVHHKDARELLDIVPPTTVDLTVTSPPYFDLKDYGSKKQIGYGQSYKAYLDDLKKVFEKVFTATKDHGSLWVIIDSFRRDQELLPLPFDLAAVLKEVGWSLKDVIIWKKERTLPWLKQGATRNIFEYILVFSKNGRAHKYFPDRLRETEELKHWWVKYPERYNPKGKALEEIWTFDIPTQGAWGNGYVRHFCPLPEGLVQRIIDLTTNPGDVVLDPFSGSGTVPAQALFMNRKYIGFELNRSYIKDFERYICENKKIKSDAYASQSRHEITDAFQETIISLRILKMGRLLFKAIEKKYPELRVRLLTNRLNEPPNEKFKIVRAKYTFVTDHHKNTEGLLGEIKLLASRPPLSKYGIQAEFKITHTDRVFSNALRDKKRLYGYTPANTHKFKLSVSSINAIDSTCSILSPICVNLNEEDYK